MKLLIRTLNLGCCLFILIVCLIGSPRISHANEQQAIFAGGCFWCMEHDFEQLSGVVSVESGYTGGSLLNPTYKNHKGHQEAVLVSFNPLVVSYQKLLKNYWKNVDPLDGDGQFCDRGDSYRPVIFTANETQREDAIVSLKEAANELNLPISSLKVEITDVNKFWLAEEYHQDYSARNAFKYNFYRYSCGRDNRLNEIWGGSNRGLAKDNL